MVLSLIVCCFCWLIEGCSVIQRKFIRVGLGSAYLLKGSLQG